MKWGSFAGGAAQGLTRGVGLSDTMTRDSAIKQGMEQSASRFGDEKAQRARDAEYFDFLAGVMSGKIKPEQLYKKMTKDASVGIVPRSASGMGMEEPGAPMAGLGSV